MSLLNTDLKREKEHLTRFLTMARDYGRANGFKGTFYIEPKPMEPTKHQYDFDVETVAAMGLFGSVDTSRGDPRNGWDTDQFPNSYSETTLVTDYGIMRAHGFRRAADWSRFDPYLSDHDRRSYAAATPHGFGTGWRGDSAA